MGKSKLVVCMSISAAISITACSTSDTSSSIQSITSVTSGSPAGAAMIAANASGDKVALWEEAEVTTNDETATSAYRCERTLLKVQTGTSSGWSTASTLQTGLNRKVAKLKREFETKNSVSVLKTETISDYIANRVAFQPQAFVTASGDVIALWIENHKADGTQDACTDLVSASDNSIQLQLYTATYTKSSASWSTPSRFDSATGSVSNLKLVSDSQGNAYVVWRQTANAKSTTETDRSGSGIIMGNSYRAATSAWETATRLSTSGEAADSPDVASDNAGSAMAVWRQSDSGDDYGVFAKRYIVNVGWDTTVSQLSSANIQAKAPVVGVDSGANATVVWAQRKGTETGTTIYSARFTYSGASWASATTLQTDDSSTASYNEATEVSYDPAIAVDSAGNVFVSWTQERRLSPMANKWNNDVLKHIYANVYVNNAWGNSMQIDTATRLDSDRSRVGVTSQDRFIVAWREGGAFHSVYIRPYTVASGLGSVETLASDDAIVNRIALSKDATGNVRAMWMTSSAINEATVH